jgi:hypothetical protein
VVEWLWDRLGKALAEDGRCLVYGTATLVQPSSGVILARALGTAYALRVPPERMTQALGEGYRQVWETGPRDARETLIDLATTHGPDWVIGRHEHAEARWCRTLFQYYSEPPAANHALLTAASPASAAPPRGTLVMTLSEAPAFRELEVLDPSEDTVEQAIRGRPWTVMTFVTLVRDAVSITASGSLQPEDGLSLAYFEHGNEYVTCQAPDLSVVVDLLRSFTRGDDAWRTRVAWE